MKTTSTVTAAFAVLLLAGVSASALAQPADPQHRAGRGQDGSPSGTDRPMRGPRDGDSRQGPPPGPPAAAPAPPAAAAPAPGQREWNRAVPRGYGPGGSAGNPNRDARPDERRPPAPAANGERRDWNQDRGDHRDRAENRGDNRGDNRDWDRRRGERPPTWQRGRYPPIYQSHQRYRIGGYRAPSGYYSRAWGFGDILPRGWYGDRYRLGDFWTYDLPYPPPGYEWVRVGSDALLIDAYSGRIVQVVRYLFW